MVNEIPSFRTCPICKCAKLKDEVRYDAILDGEKVKICGDCYKEHGAGFKRQLLQETTANFRTNV